MTAAVIVRHIRGAVTLAKAVEDAGPIIGDGAALLTGRTSFRVVGHHGGALLREEALDDAEDVYEARVFGAGGELRWQHEIGEEPVAVLVRPEGGSAAGPPEEWKAIDHVSTCGTIEQRYLLWGRAAPVAGGSRLELAEARIGRLQVPIDGLETGKGAQLVACEYLGVAEGDPNTRVVEELLVRLEAGETEWPEGLEG